MTATVDLAQTETATRAATTMWRSAAMVRWSKDATVLPSTRPDADSLSAPFTDGGSSSTFPERGYRVSSPLIQPPQPLRNSQFKALARWEGAVLEVFDKHFVTEVIDLQNDERAIAEFEWNDISSSDRALCEPGALFYWSVGYDIKESGQRSRASIIRFRRLGLHIGSVG